MVVEKGWMLNTKSIREEIKNIDLSMFIKCSVLSSNKIQIKKRGIDPSVLGNY
jgi:hypothetical protein